MGTTLVHMEQLLHGDTIVMSWMFTTHGIGHLTGTILSGFLYDLLNHELLFAVTIWIEVLAVCFAPFTGSLYTYFLMTAIQGVSWGIIGTSRMSEVISVYWFLVKTILKMSHKHPHSFLPRSTPAITNLT